MREFVRGGRLVRVGRRFYLTRKVTVSAVYAALDRFAPEIAALGALRRAGDLKTSEVIERGVKALAARPAEAAEILAGCVEAGGLDEAGVVAQLAAHPGDVAAVARAVLEETDLDALMRGLAPADGEEKGDPNLSIGLICRAVRASPAEIAGWPYEAFLRAVEVAKAMQPRDLEEETVEESAAAPGVAVIGGGVH